MHQRKGEWYNNVLSSMGKNNVSEPMSKQLPFKCIWFGSGSSEELMESNSLSHRKYVSFIEELIFQGKHQLPKQWDIYCW